MSAADDADRGGAAPSGRPRRVEAPGEVDLRPAPDPADADDAATLIASLAREGPAPAPGPAPASPPPQTAQTPQNPQSRQRSQSPQSAQTPPRTPTAPAATAGAAPVGAAGGGPGPSRPSPPPPPGQTPGPPRVPDARPYPVEPERQPLTLVAIGAGIGLGVLVLAGLIALGMRLVGGSAPDAGSAVPDATATPIAQSGISVTASSTQESDGGITYSAENTLDGRPETAWNSDGRKDGKGPGMTLTYGFGDPVELHSITVLNGYQKTITSSGKTQDLFALNSRVRLMRVVTDSATFTWELTDDRTPQTLTKAFGRTSSVRFEVLSVYPGTKYLDLGVSEVSFTALG